MLNRFLRETAAAAVLLLVVAVAATTATAMAATTTAHLPVSYKPACTSKAAHIADCLVLVRTTAVPATTPGVPAGYGPADLKSAYALPAGGAGQAVAIVDAYHNPNAQADLNTYRSTYGLPATSVHLYGQTGGPPPAAVDPSGGWEVEESLDVDMVSAICPLCTIDLVEADSAGLTDLATAADTAATTLGAKYVSNSYGASGGEFPGETTLDPFYTHPGVAVTASAGDSGYGTTYPAASPGVVAVGGTSLTRGGGGRGWTETVWTGTGSGCSSQETKPSWQHDSGCSNRTDTDVAAVADPDTGVAVYDSYPNTLGFPEPWMVVGGTSAASPIIASVYALAGPPAPSANPASYPYANHTAASINDITTGSNGSCSPAYLCTGTTGYDGPTGWGTPEGVCAFTATGCVTPAPVVTGVTPTSGPSAGGTHVTVSGTNLAAGSVQFGTTPAAGVSCSATSCAATSPAHTAGTVDVRVTTSGGTSAPVAADHFTYTTPPPPVGPIHGYGGKCLDDYFSGGPGAKVNLWWCDGTGAQRWTLAANGTYQVLGHCMNIQYASVVNGAKVIVWSCPSGAVPWNDVWVHLANGEIRNPHSGKCLNDPGYSTAAGVQQIIWSCVNTPNEHYTVP